jgi:hypothetical protein
MGTACSAIRDSPPPNARSPNKNICTVYRDNIPTDNDDDILDVSSIISLYSMKPIGRETSAIDSDQYKSKYIVVEDVCLAPAEKMSTTGQGRDYCKDIGGDENNPEWTTFDAEDVYTWSGAVDEPTERANLYRNCKWTTEGVWGHSIHTDAFAGCCKGECLWVLGHKGACRRQGYSGDKATCCFRDFNCKNFGGDYKDIQSCYSDTNQRYTCDPYYRDLKSENCKKAIAPYCLGTQFFPAQTDWMELWLPDSVVNISNDPDNEKIMVKAPCLMAVMRNLFGKAADGICDYDTLSSIKLEGFNDSGSTWAVEIINEVFTTYIKKFGNPLKGINQDGYIKSAAFFNFMFNFCKQNPNVCTDFLKKQLCINTKQDQVMNDAQTNNWCGCYMPDSEYEKYNQYGIEPECTPFCNQKDTIKLANVDGTEKVCTQTSCIINDAIITALNDRFPDGFNFSQICHSCGQNTVSERLSMNKSDDKNSNGGIVLNTGPNLFYQYNLSSGEEYFLNDTDYYLISSLSPIYTGNLFLEDILINSDLDWTGPNLQDYSLLNIGNAPVIQFKDFNGNSGIKCEKDKPEYAHPGYSHEKGIAEGIRCYITDFVIKNDNVIDTDKLKLSTGSIIGLRYKLNKGANYNKLKKEDLSIIDTSQSAKPSFNFSNSYDPNNINTKDRNYSLANVFFTNQIDNQEIRNNITEYGKEAASNTCFCIMDGTTINITDAKVGNLNLVENCGQVSCHDNSGKMIPCDNGSNNLDDNSYMDDNDSFSTYKTEEKKKVDLVVIMILFAIFIILVMIRTVQTYFNPKVKKTKDKI